MILGALLALPAAAQTPEWVGRVRLTLASGTDTNPTRSYGALSDPTWALVAFASGEALWRHDHLHAEGAYDGAARAFPTLLDQSTLAQTVRLRLTGEALPWLGVGALARGKDRRGGNRDYSDLIAGAFLSFHLARRVDLTLEGRAHRFIYWPLPDYSFGSPDAALQLQYGVTPQHWLFVDGEAGRRAYGAPANNPAGESLGFLRRDVFLAGGGGYRYRGAVSAGIEYRYSSQISNSFGQTLLRQRIAASFGAPLPLGFIVLAQAAIQFTAFPDGVYLAQDLLLADDDENLNSASVKLSRPVTAWLELEARYGVYQGVLPHNGLHYLRHVASLGATVRWSGL